MLGLLALLVTGASAALWIRGTLRVRLPRNRAGFVASWIAGGLLAAAELARGGSWLPDLAAGLALVVTAFLCFTVAISRQRVAPDAIRVGDTLPDFGAEDENGAPLSRSDLVGAPVLLKFFRGHW